MNTNNEDITEFLSMTPTEILTLNEKEWNRFIEILEKDGTETGGEVLKAFEKYRGGGIMNSERVKQLYRYRIEEVEKEKADRLLGGYPSETVIEMYNEELEDLKKAQKNALEVIETLNVLNHHYKVKGK